MSEQEYTSLQLRLTAEAERIGGSTSTAEPDRIPTVTELETRRRRRQIASRSIVASLFSLVVVGTAVMQSKWQLDRNADDGGHGNIAAQFDDSEDEHLRTQMEIPLAPSARAHIESLVDRGAVPIVMVRPGENGRRVLIPGVYVPPSGQNPEPKELSPVGRRGIRNVLGSETETRPDAI